MKYFKFKYSGKKPLKLALLGDVHWGSTFCDKELLNNVVTKLKKDKDTKIILMGDLIENASKQSVGSSVYQQEESPNEQTWTIARKLKPLGKNILYSLRGNHEERSFRFTGFDIGEAIANYIGIPYTRNMVIVDIEIGKIKYRLFTWHGHGSSQTTAGRIKILQKQAETFSADCYCMGHVHELFSVPMSHRDVEKGEFKDIFRQYVLTGGFLKWDESYAEQFGYRMVKGGMPVLSLSNKKKEIKVDLEYV